MVARTTPTVVMKPGPPAWIVVRCPQCGKAICEAKSGSTLKIVCKRCKAESVTNVA